MSHSRSPEDRLEVSRRGLLKLGALAGATLPLSSLLNGIFLVQKKIRNRRAGNIVSLFFQKIDLYAMVQERFVLGKSFKSLMKLVAAGNNNLAQFVNFLRDGLHHVGIQTVGGFFDSLSGTASPPSWRSWWCSATSRSRWRSSRRW